MVTELLKADGDEAPGAVQDRLRALPPLARELARLVSVIPTRADTEAVAVAHRLNLAAERES